eukprot:TRINITY_DN2600_c0_g1_i1.p1 TRINITY_DN2600_c0_g1~~TRINITY_DN2600_c0_g1_i1.p1  ORF type:complete len:166 (-),score=30.63 TRINITY_DN2600_c0_g1_i1:102-599(-)
MHGPPPSLSKRVFSKYDKDGSGHVNSSEFKSMCYDLGHSLSEAELSIALKKVDHDGSGVITYPEFEKWWKTGTDRFSSLKLTPEEQQTLSVCINYFKYFDKDQSGTISAAEFKTLHADLIKNKLTTKPVEKCLEELDKDRSGTVSFNEYVDWLVAIGSVRVKVLP